MERLYDKLKAYSVSDFYAFHMPGHKRNKSLLGIELPYDLDITEIDGFDDLHHADGILKEEQERAARVFGAEESHFLVNGSTAGILSAVMGCTRRGDKILVARHCHKSIYHAIYMNGLVPRYVYPEFDISMHMNGEISKEDVAKALEAEPDIKAVVIVSPNYDGVVSDVKGIAEVVHSYGIPLIVDEAHGPHFGFHPAFPERANDLGADVVINSLHKTLPSLTQTAILHINGKFANRRRIKKYLDMLQSSSPSYILMSSIDACIGLLEETQKEQVQEDESETYSDARSDCKYKNIFSEYAKRIEALRKDLKRLKYLKIIQTDHTDRYDRSKFVISVKHAPMSSHELYDILLHKYHLQMEMLAGTYVLAMTTVGDTGEGLNRLRDALLEIDTELDRRTVKEQEKKDLLTDSDLPLSGRQPSLEKVWTIAEAVNCKDAEQCGLRSYENGKDAFPFGRTGHAEKRTFTDSIGCISLEYAYLYPPGSPLIVPGERITKEAVEILHWYQEHDFSIEGLQSEDGIEVWIDG